MYDARKPKHKINYGVQRALSFYYIKCLQKLTFLFHLHLSNKCFLPFHYQKYIRINKNQNITLLFFICA